MNETKGLNIQSSIFKTKVSCDYYPIILTIQTKIVNSFSAGKI